MKWNNPERVFLTTAAILTSRSVLNLIWHTTPRSLVNWLQQLGCFLSASAAKTADLRRRLAASEEKAKINQMVRDYKERGVSTFHHDRWQMAHVFKQIILPHIVDRPTRVYFENLDRGEAEPEELGRAFSQLIKIAKSAKGDIFRRKLRDSDLSATDKLYYSKLNQPF